MNVTSGKFMPRSLMARQIWSNRMPSFHGDATMAIKATPANNSRDDHPVPGIQPVRGLIRLLMSAAPTWIKRCSLESSLAELDIPAVCRQLCEEIAEVLDSPFPVFISLRKRSVKISASVHGFQGSVRIYSMPLLSPFRS